MTDSGHGDAQLPLPIERSGSLVHLADACESSRVARFEREVNELCQRLGEAARYLHEAEKGTHPGHSDPADPADPAPDLTRKSTVPHNGSAGTETWHPRPARRPDFEAENRALGALIHALANAPHSILQTLTEKILQVTRAGAAGISLLTEVDPSFFWPAFTGAWQAHAGSGAPHEGCSAKEIRGDDPATAAASLFRHLEHGHPYFLAITPPAEDHLLVPFHVDGKAVGTLWAIARDDLHPFDAEDLRQLQSLAGFASAAHRSGMLGAVGQRGTALRREDAVLSARAIEKLNLDRPVNEEPARGGASDPRDLVARNAVIGLHRIAPDGSVVWANQADVALRESEAFNRTIIESSPDCIKVLDLHGNLLSMLNGQDLLGIEDIRPYLNTSWIEFWSGDDRAAAQAAIEAAKAGDEGRFVGRFQAVLGDLRWWDVSVAPIVDSNEQPTRLLVVSRDVSPRRHAELNFAFLASVSQDLVRWTSVEDMMRAVGAKMGAHLALSLCAFVDVNEAADEVVIAHDWHRDDVPGLTGTHRLKDFVGAEFIRTARAGHPIVVSDTTADARTDADTFAAMKIAAFICVPLIRDGQWRFAMCLYRSAPCDWRDDEIALTVEVTARVWTRLERLRAEEGLRQSEKRYRTLFESIDEGFCILEKTPGSASEPVDFRVVEANPAFVMQSGVSGVVGKTLREKFPCGGEAWYVTYDTVLRTGEPMRFERESPPSGHVLEACVFRVEHDASFRLGVVFKDITERKRAEQVLRQRTAQFQTLLDGAPLGVYLVDADFCLCQANPVALERFGSIPNVIGQDCAEIFQKLWPKPMADEIIRRFRHTLDTGEPYIVPELIEERLDSLVTEYYEWQISRIPLSDGRNGVVCYFRDISERVRTHNRIRDSEERYRNLFNSMDEGYCVIEIILDEHEKPVDYRFIEVNPSFEQHTGMHNAVGKRIREFFPQFEASWFEQYGQVALKGESIRFVNYSKELMRWFDVYAFRIGRPGNWKVAVIFTNITERTNAEQALRASAQTMIELDRRKDEFLAMLCHELRNPLAPISNAVNLLRLQQTGDPVQQQATNIIDRQVRQLTHLVDELLEISRINTGRVQLRREPVAVSEIIDRAAETLHPLVSQRRHELSVSMPSQPLWVNADPSRLEQVLVNLLTNAAKYTDEGGHIELSVEREGDEAVLRVRDTGIGIASELLPHIFDLFTQGQRSLDRAQGGLGIGLSLVQKLVELHGGTVEAFSSLGQGSEFVVRLPALQDFTPAVASGCRVMVVDDNVDLARSLVMLLEMSGHDVRMFHDGPSALEAALVDQPDVVLLDIGLPGFDGFEVARRIRRHPALDDVVLVAMTGYARGSERQRSQEAGFDHHLVKPADFDEVLKILATVAPKASGK